jgi:protein associated with RNAse G/E
MTGEDVRVVYTKFDGSLHWHQTMTRLGQDEHGVWLGARPGILAQRGHEPAIVVRQAHVMLFRPDVWWTAVFNARPQRVEIYCDITSPISWPEPDQVTMVDLDLDVVRGRTGKVSVLDEDEFAEHQVRYGYPADVIDQAWSATKWLTAALADGTEPFATRYRFWLEQMRDPWRPWRKRPSDPAVRAQT